MAWQKVASLGDFGDRDAIGIEVAGTPIALFRLGNEVHATSGICTHEFASLADGFVETADGSVECPLHQALFDIRTGKALCAPATENLKVYPVRIDGSDVFIDVDGVARNEAAPIAAAAAPRAAAAEPAPVASGSRNGRNGTSAKPANGGGSLERRYVWPDDDLSVIPDWVYTDQSIYEREIERIFHGRTWNYVALEAEVPKPGDFIRSNVGTDAGRRGARRGRLDHVFENRCAHRASEFCRELTGIGQGIRLPVPSMDLRAERQPASAFRSAAASTAKAACRRISTRRSTACAGSTSPRHRGVVFASYADDMESLADYLGPEVLREFEATFDGRKPESARPLPPFAAGQLEALPREPQGSVPRDAAAHLPGDVRAAGRRQPFADARRRERAARRDGLGEIRRESVAGDAKKEMRAYKEGMTLREPRFMDFVEEFDSPWSVTMATIWPNLIVQREMNTLGVRQIVPTGPHEFIMKWTMFGFEGDDEAMTRHRLRQGNLMGPAGFLGLEDNEAIKFVQDGMRRVPNGQHLVKLDPDNPHGTSDTLISEVRHSRHVPALARSDGALEWTSRIMACRRRCSIHRISRSTTAASKRCCCIARSRSSTAPMPRRSTSSG